MRYYIVLFICLFCSTTLFATDYLAEVEYYQKKADGYRREAAYYEQKAKGYEREAEYYIKKAEGYQREGHSRYMTSEMLLQTDLIFVMEHYHYVQVQKDLPYAQWYKLKQMNDYCYGEKIDGHRRSTPLR